MIQANCNYYIKVRGEVDENAFDTNSPFLMKVIEVYPDSTLFKICADQSGLVGMIRHLHAQGFALLSIYRGGYEEA